MKTKIYIFLIVIFFLSCKTHKIIYAYEDNNSYTVLKLSDKYMYVNYKSYFKKGYHKLIVINGNKIFPESIGISFLSDLITVDYKRKIKVCPSFDHKKGFKYAKSKIVQDSIFLIGVGDDRCFKENNITWFPPYMKRVKKIDYSKFPKEIKEAFKAIDKEKFDKLKTILKKKN